jgi:hypothetical protein
MVLVYASLVMLLSGMALLLADRGRLLLAWPLLVMAAINLAMAIAEWLP